MPKSSLHSWVLCKSGHPTEGPALPLQKCRTRERTMAPASEDSDGPDTSVGHQGQATGRMEGHNCHDGHYGHLSTGTGAWQGITFWSLLYIHTVQYNWICRLGSYLMSPAYIKSVKYCVCEPLLMSCGRNVWLKIRWGSPVSSRPTPMEWKRWAVQNPPIWNPQIYIPIPLEIIMELQIYQDLRCFFYQVTFCSKKNISSSNIKG